MVSISTQIPCLAPERWITLLLILDVDALASALEGYFFSIRNSSSITPASEDRWQTAIQFVREVSQRQSNNSRAVDLHERFARLESLHSSLHIGRRRRAERVRALPAEVVEHLYELLDPESKINPFQNAVSRWRTYVLFHLYAASRPAPWRTLSSARRCDQERF